MKPFFESFWAQKTGVGRGNFWVPFLGIVDTVFLTDRLLGRASTCPNKTAKMSLEIEL